jgi:hypothetical protein
MTLGCRTQSRARRPRHKRRQKELLAFLVLAHPCGIEAPGFRRILWRSVVPTPSAALWAGFSKAGDAHASLEFRLLQAHDKPDQLIQQIKGSGRQQNLLPVEQNRLKFIQQGLVVVLSLGLLVGLHLID